MLPPATFAAPAPWQPSLSLAEWLRPRILELSYTAEDLRPFAEELGFHGDPFVWDEARRTELRAELDAAFFHLYLPARRDGSWKPCAGESAADYAALTAAFPTPRHAVDYIMDTFPIVRRKDEVAYGSYRTKERILAAYDAMLNHLPLKTPPVQPGVCLLAFPFLIRRSGERRVILTYHGKVTITGAESARTPSAPWGKSSGFSASPRSSKNALMRAANSHRGQLI